MTEELEKEAESKAIETCPYNLNMPTYAQGFVNGAEFGYNKAKVEVEESYRESLCNSELNLASVTEQLEELNKANEWHKQEVDDIYDLISKDWSIRYFICIMKDKSRITAIGNCDEGCNGEVSVNLFFEHDDEKYYIDDIAWWKEIVFPEEEKEND